jgi:hypothetical protein
MPEYRNGLTKWVKDLSKPKMDKVKEELRSGKSYWVIYWEYMGLSKSVAVRDLTSAICISLRNNGYVRQYGGQS